MVYVKVDQYILYVCHNMIMHGRYHAIDIVGFLSIISTLTTGMTASPSHMWFMLLWSVTNRLHKHSSDSKTIESQWCNWFEVAKALSALAGALALTLIQLLGLYNELTHIILSTLLMINIFEAILSECYRYGMPNALTGLVLLYITPVTSNAKDIEHLAAVARDNQLAVFPLSVEYIILYTTWNAAFSYGGNWSWSTRLILLAPVITCLCYQTTYVWLCARCLSLMLNMILRASECTDFYKPGLTIVTHVPRSFRHNTVVYTVWGCLNLFLAACIYKGGLLDSSI